MDICDVLDESGRRTGRTATRGTKLAHDEYYLVVHVWIRSELGEFLVQRRSPNLASDPGIWATTVGHVLANEESMTAAIRETQEELGIQLLPAQLSRVDRLKTGNRIEDLWMAVVSKGTMGAPILGPEVIAWKWSTKHELRQMMSNGAFFAYSYIEELVGL